MEKIKEISKLLIHDKVVINEILGLYAMRLPGNWLMYYFCDPEFGKITSSQIVNYPDFEVQDWEHL